MSPEQVEKITETLAPLLVSWGVKIVGVLLLLWIGLRVASWFGDKITTKLEGREFDKSLSRFFGQLVRWGVTAGVVLACLGVFGVETTSFAAVIGAAGLAIGLAFQGTLGNFAAGVLLLVFRPFKVGDVVSTGGKIGAIVEIGLFTCTLDTADNRRIIVGNTAVASGTIENITHHKKRRVDVDVGVDYGADIDETRKQLEKAIELVDTRLQDGAHQVFLKNLGDSSVNWQLRIWCKTEDYWTVWQETVRAIKMQLDEAALNIPFPTMQVHIEKDAA